MVRIAVGDWKAAFNVCPLMGGGSLTKEWSKSRAALKEYCNYQVDLGRWTSVQILPLCIQMQKFMGVE